METFRSAAAARLQLDGNNIGGAGGSSMTIGGTLTNTSTNGNAISIGNTGITSADTLTVNGTGGLSSTGEINIEGSATVQATLDVANAAAGFGTAGTETGKVYPPERRALGVQERPDHDGRRRAVARRREGARRRRRHARQQQRADRALTSVSGNFWLQNGATVSPDRQCEHHRQRHDRARRQQRSAAAGAAASRSAAT